MSPLSAPLFTDDDRAFLRAAVRAGLANPFAPARPDAPPASPEDARRTAARLRPILDRAAARIAAGAPADADLALHQEASVCLLRDLHDPRLQPLLVANPPLAAIAAAYRAFLDDHGALLAFPGSPLRPPRPEHVFACAVHLARAYHHIASRLIGTSRPAAALRATVWDAVFTRDLGAYLRACDRRRSDVSTLITGPTGTGKELVAQAIGRSRFVAFDAKAGRFDGGPGEDFCAVDLSAISGNLFESELFGHRKGAFTGAVADKKGIFASVRAGGAVFLDEIGELEHDRQVKLLRVLESRVFHRVGETEEDPFSARVLAATHRDLGEQVRAGDFRLDLYQRLAGVRIETPSLRAQLDDAPGDLALLVGFLARKVTDEDAAPALADEVVRFVEANLARYMWPGNVRELLRCVESVQYSGGFVPLDVQDDEDPAKSLREGTLTSAEAACRYATIVAASCDSYSEAARRLGVHRNTVAGMVDETRLSRLRSRRRRPQRPRPPLRDAGEGEDDEA